MMSEYREMEPDLMCQACGLFNDPNCNDENCGRMYDGLPPIIYREEEPDDAPGFDSPVPAGSS